MKSLPGAGGTDLLPISAPELNGHIVNISTTPGWRVVYFWGASCPCVKACEHYSLVPMAKKYKGKISFFAVASDGWDLSMTKTQLAQQIASEHLPFPVLLDTKHTIALGLHAQVTPETFVLDPQGKIVFHGMPDDSRQFAYLKIAHTYLAVALAEAMAGKPITNSPLQQAGCMIAW